MRFMHWGRNFLEVLCFSPRWSPLFFLLSDTKHLRRRGKNTIFRFAFPWNFHEFDGFRWQPLFVACNFEKFFGNVWLKLRMQVVVVVVFSSPPPPSGLRWQSVRWAPHRARRGGNYFFCSSERRKKLDYGLMLVLPEEHGVFPPSPLR